MYYKIAFSLIVLVSMAFCMPPIQCTQVNQSEIPDSIKGNGIFVDGISWRDSVGSHTIVCYKKSLKKRDDLIISKLTFNKKSVVINWKVHDFIVASSEKSIDLVRGSLTLADYNNDGNFESRFLYEIISEGEPITFKYMLHLNDKKYAVRGSVPVGFDDSTDCEMADDSTFSLLNTNVRSIALEECKALLKEQYSCFLNKIQ